MSFMFSVLGSVMFWVLFFVTGFVIGSILLKHIAPRTFKHMILGQKDSWLYGDAVFFILIGCFIMWPIVLVGLSIKFIIGKILWPLFRHGVKKSVSIIPDIEIKKPTKE